MATGRGRGWRRVGAQIVLGVAGLAAAAWIELPMEPVPMTLQTYAVLVIGALYGWRLGLATVGAYLAAAALGLPVLAGGSAGLDRLTGPTGGYLVGFAAAVVVVGVLAERGWTRSSFARSQVTMLGGHALILATGACWLAAHLGWRSAWTSGVEPFLLGALVKSLLAGGTVWLLARRQRIEPGA